MKLRGGLDKDKITIPIGGAGQTDEFKRRDSDNSIKGLFAGMRSKVGWFLLTYLQR